MEHDLSLKTKLVWLSLFAITMAIVESAIVAHLRQIYYPENICIIFPVKAMTFRDLLIELVREAATVIMLLSAAVLSERKKIVRVFACFVFLFGLWDIFYYVWLKVFINWPLTMGEWDILFLIPWVWLSPWICPVLISLVFIVWGVWVLVVKREISFRAHSLILFIAGCIIQLASFLEPGIRLMLTHLSEKAISFTPGNFLWWLFIPGFLIMNSGLGLTLLKLKPRG